LYRCAVVKQVEG